MKKWRFPYLSGDRHCVFPSGGNLAMTLPEVSRRGRIHALRLEDGMPHVRAGKLRALGVSSVGVSSVRRAAAAPDISSIAETGVPGYESGQWYGLFAPPGTAQGIA